MMHYVNAVRLRYGIVTWVVAALLPAFSAWARVAPAVSDSLAGHPGGPAARAEVMAALAPQVRQSLRVRDFSLSKVEGLPEQRLTLLTWKWNGTGRRMFFTCPKVPCEARISACLSRSKAASSWSFSRAPSART